MKQRIYLYEREDGTLLATSDIHENLNLLDIAIVQFNNKLGEWVDGRKQIEPLERAGNE